METMLGLWLLPSGLESAGQFLVLAPLSALIMGAAKGGFAGSVGILSMPLMIYACQDHPRLSPLGIILPLLILCDYVAVGYWRWKWDSRNIRFLVPGAVLGVGIGSAVLWGYLRMGRGPEGMAGPNLALRLTIGLIALGFVALQAVRAARGELRAYRPGFAHGFGIGAAAGLTSTLTHSAGPITTMYLLPQQMAKETYVATATLYYWIGNQVKVVPYALLGLLDTDTLLTSAVLAPAVVAGAALGIFLHHRVNQRIFNLIVYSLLALMGAHLTVSSIQGLCS